MWQFFTEQLAHNQFLSGGAFLAIIGAAFVTLKSVPGHIWSWIKRRIITEIDIPDRDESFKWINVWLAQHPYHKRCRLWTVHTKRHRSEDDEYTSGSSESRSKKAKVILSPAPGVHFLFYKRRLLILRRDRKEGGNKNTNSLVPFHETFNFTLFSRNKQIVLDLIEEARQAAYPPTDARVTILRSDYGSWCEAGKRLPRSINSVILADNLADRLVDDVQKFQDSESWYNSRGIPYRRGYLLHGKPGNGKSSVVMALATKFQYDICTLNLSSGTLNDDRLMELMGSLPQHSFVIIEDIDCVFQQRKKADEKESVTFSGLLNAIDGIVASEGRILFMTTNHIDQLDPALIRPGRVDLSVELKNASRVQMEQLYLRFFPERPDLAQEFSKLGEPHQWSMATLQGHLLQYRESPVDALTNPISVV